MYQEKLSKKLIVMSIISGLFLLFIVIINNPFFYDKAKDKTEVIEKYVAKDVTLVLELSGNELKKESSYLDESIKYVKIIDEKNKEHKIEGRMFPSIYVSSYTEDGIFNGDEVKLTQVNQKGDLTAKIHFPLLNKKTYSKKGEKTREFINYAPIKEEVYSPIKVDVYFKNRDGKKELKELQLNNGVIEERDI